MRVQGGGLVSARKQADLLATSLKTLQDTMKMTAGRESHIPQYMVWMSKETLDKASFHSL